MARQKKTHRQRAEEALAVAERRAQRARETRDRLAGDLAIAEAELTLAVDLLHHAKQHPALQSTTPTTTQENA